SGQNLQILNQLYIEDLLKPLCFEMEQLSKIIPQLDDYTCPICLNISWKPIRLHCGHVFCHRCLVKAGRKGTQNCPICRAKNAIYDADQGNLDVSLMNFLKLYFPQEAKKKQKANEREQANEDVELILGLRFNERQRCTIQ
ncbi:1173_t:CDS:2, partial [Scutellospora calospora]